MTLKEEQIDEIKDAVEEALNDMLPRFLRSDLKSRLMTAMEADIGHVDFPNGRTAGIHLRVEIETKECD
jgi:hypothetical protein